MSYSAEKKDYLRELEEVAELKAITKQAHLNGKLVKQGFHYDTKELFEPITKTVNKKVKICWKIPKPREQQMSMSLITFRELIIFKLTHRNFSGNLGKL